MLKYYILVYLFFLFYFFLVEVVGIGDYGLGEMIVDNEEK